MPMMTRSSTVFLEELGRDQNNKIQRYKGLGEMDAEQLGRQLWILKEEFFFKS